MIRPQPMATRTLSLLIRELSAPWQQNLIEILPPRILECGAEHRFGFAGRCRPSPKSRGGRIDSPGDIVAGTTTVWQPTWRAGASTRRFGLRRTRPLARFGGSFTSGGGRIFRASTTFHRYRFRRRSDNRAQKSSDNCANGSSYHRPDHCASGAARHSFAHVKSWVRFLTVRPSLHSCFRRDWLR